MRFLIMLLIVIGLAASDIVTGWICAHVNSSYSSAVMRRGGLRKLAEIAVMATACGLETGIELLGSYYSSPELAAVAGGFTAVAVFIYIVVMELISILENYAKINPDAGWTLPLISRLQNFHRHKDD